MIWLTVAKSPTGVMTKITGGGGGHRYCIVLAMSIIIIVIGIIIIIIISTVFNIHSPPTRGVLLLLLLLIVVTVLPREAMIMMSISIMKMNAVVVIVQIVHDFADFLQLLADHNLV